MTSRNPDDYELLQQQQSRSAGRVDADRRRHGDRALPAPEDAAPFLFEDKRPFGGLRRAGAHPRVRAVLFAVGLLAVGASVAVILPARRSSAVPGRASTPSDGESPGTVGVRPLDKIVKPAGDENALDALVEDAPAESSASEQAQDTPFQTLASSAASGTATLTAPASSSSGLYVIPGTDTLSTSDAGLQTTEFSASTPADGLLTSSTPVPSSGGACATGIACDGADAGRMSASAAPDAGVESPASFDPPDAAAATASTADDSAFSAEAAAPTDPAITQPAGDGYYEQAGGCAAGTPCDGHDAGGVSTSAAADGDGESPASFDPFAGATITSTAGDPASTTEAAPPSTPPTTQPADDSFYKLEGECATGTPCDGVDIADVSTSAGGDVGSPTSFDPFDAATITSTADNPPCTTEAVAPNDPATTQPADDEFYELCRVDENGGGAGLPSTGPAEASTPGPSTAATPTTTAETDFSASAIGVGAAGETAHKVQPYASADASLTTTAEPDASAGLTGDVSAAGVTAPPSLSALPAEMTDNGAGASVVNSDGEIADTLLPSTAASPEVPDADEAMDTGEVATPTTEPSSGSDELGGAFSAKEAELLADGGFF